MQLGIIPFAGVDIAAFEIFKEQLLCRYHGDPPPMAILGAGMMSSSIAQFASYPLALVRTRLQVNMVSHCCICCLVPSPSLCGVPYLWSAGKSGCSLLPMVSSSIAQ